MVFPSVPVYIDPRNWNQQQAHHQPESSRGGVSGSGEAPHLPTGAVAPRPEGPMAGSIRPGSMADRARLAKIPQPEPALKCPRCDSANTKFCYFNNYSLSQPRHFCKTCRRYWTRGGALRNVPVGGGCRRNKRTKSTSSSTSKSSTATTADRHVGASSSTSSTATSVGVGGAIPSNLPLPTQLPFMAATLHPLADYNAANIGLSFGGIQHVDPVDYQVGVSSSSGGGVGLEQWRLSQIQQFPFLGGLEAPPPPTAPVPGLYPFDGDGNVGVDGGAFTAPLHGKATCSGLITQLASVKMEDNQHGLSLPRHYLGVPRNDQYWGSSSGGGTRTGSGWATDLSGFNSSSAGNLL